MPFEASLLSPFLQRSRTEVSTHNHLPSVLIHHSASSAVTLLLSDQNPTVDDITTHRTLSVYFLSHRFFTPPAATTRAHWRHLHQLWPHPLLSPAPPSLASALTLLTVAPRRRRRRESAPGPCVSPPSSASSCLSTPRLLPWRQRGAASGSSLRNRRNTASIAKTQRRAAHPAPPTFLSWWLADASFRFLRRCGPSVKPPSAHSVAVAEKKTCARS